MSHSSVPLVVPDLSSFTRRLGRALAERDESRRPPPRHVELLNLVARAAGYRNVQALQARPPVIAARARLPLTPTARRALGHFDAEGRLMRLPMRLAVRTLVLWPLWTPFDAKRAYSEREVNAILREAHTFGDHATLRRALVDQRLLERTSDCAVYRKRPVRPDDEARALLTEWRARRHASKANDDDEADRAA